MGIVMDGMLQLSYAIGVAEPLSIFVSSYGTGIKTDAELLEIVKANFDLRPGKIVKWVIAGCYIRKLCIRCWVDCLQYKTRQPMSCEAQLAAQLGTGSVFVCICLVATPFWYTLVSTQTDSCWPVMLLAQSAELKVRRKCNTKVYMPMWYWSTLLVSRELNFPVSCEAQNRLSVLSEVLYIFLIIYSHHWLWTSVNTNEIHHICPMS